ncbi:Uncharacterized protein HZ326_29334 [Fusarium oxysporum f. sp. albedinis]|nr:Uncharacterized protein HZ326_29334 [Fusarium oxysporum f. sp. albedinis]
MGPQLDAFSLLAPTFPDYHISTILPLPARQHSSDQLLAFFPLLSSSLSSEVWFFSYSAADLTSHLLVSESAAAHQASRLHFLGREEQVRLL